MDNNEVALIHVDELAKMRGQVVGIAAGLLGAVGAFAASAPPENVVFLVAAVIVSVIVGALVGLGVGAAAFIFEFLRLRTLAVFFGRSLTRARRVPRHA